MNLQEKYKKFFVSTNNVISVDNGWYNIVDEFLSELSKIHNHEYVIIHRIIEFYGDIKIIYSIQYIRKKSNNFLDYFRVLRYNIFKNQIDRELFLLNIGINKLIVETVNKSKNTCEYCGNRNIEKLYSVYHEKMLCKNCVTIGNNFIYKA